MRITTFAALLIVVFCTLHQPAAAQRLPSLDSVSALLTNMTIQIECTSGVNDLYNFKFERAASQFYWLKRNYPKHPLPYFLLGLIQWWKMVPNIEDQQYDNLFLNYMDSTIMFAEKIFDENPDNIEAPFFLAGAYGFKGRLYAERRSWTKAAFAGKKALKYLEYSKKHTDLSPELLFGDGLYNYYSIWIPENYPALKPMLIFFSKGDKKLGIEQLETVMRDAFYTRIEAMYFLMRIYSSDENQPHKALRVSEYLYNTFPDNPYFHRYYARMLYSMGRYSELEQVSLDILRKIEQKMPGYEATSGRYASFYLASMYRLSESEIDKARKYYQETVTFSEAIKATTSGYYLYSLSNLARMAIAIKNDDLAMEHYNKILKSGEKKHPTYAEAQKFSKEYKKNAKKKKR
jgi:hypothetical protein